MIQVRRNMSSGKPLEIRRERRIGKGGDEIVAVSPKGEMRGTRRQWQIIEGDLHEVSKVKIGKRWLGIEFSTVGGAVRKMFQRNRLPRNNDISQLDALEAHGRMIGAIVDSDLHEMIRRELENNE